MNIYAKNLIKRFEGLSYRPYRCPAGRWTIGYGHKIGANETISILTDQEIEALLKQDLNERQRQLAALIQVPLTQNEEGALLSFLYNVGAGAFQRSTLRMKVNRKEHGEVVHEFRKWIWARGRKCPGLVARRAAEAQCYLGNTFSKKHVFLKK